MLSSRCLCRLQLLLAAAVPRGVAPALRTAKKYPRLLHALTRFALHEHILTLFISDFPLSARSPRLSVRVLCAARRQRAHRRLCLAVLAQAGDGRRRGREDMGEAPA